MLPDPKGGNLAVHGAERVLKELLGYNVVKSGRWVPASLSNTLLTTVVPDM
jgi:hypothetical protein